LGSTTPPPVPIEPVARRNAAFIAEREPPEDVPAVRRRISDGTPLAELVDEGRDERV